MEGYWGPVTSSVDWCEENYTWNFYIAEWWNTWTSFFIAIAGFLGIVLHFGNLEKRFYLTFFLVAIVGLGNTITLSD